MSQREVQGRGCVVVGFDNHAHSARLLSVAADEAERRSAELAVVTLLPEPHDPTLSILDLRRDQRRAQATALQQVHEAAVVLHPTYPQLPVTTYCLTESEVSSNREPLLWAALLVIGTHGQVGRQTVSAQSVSRLLLAGSRCPILVIPDDAPTPSAVRPDESRLILVGVGDHPADAAVVRAAYAESVGRGCEVLLLHAYGLRAGESAEQGLARARKVLAGYSAQAPAGTKVSVVVTEGEPVEALFRLAAGATLLVIGGRTGSLSGLVRESVSRAVLESVPCPVLAVPRDLTAGPPAPIAGLILEAANDHEPAR